jgi:hypothetical protein
MDGIMPVKREKMAVRYGSMPEKILNNHIRTVDNYAWLRENWETIYQKYQGRFIAVSNREIIFDTDNFIQILDYISKNRKLTDIIAIHVRSKNAIILR